MIKRLKYLYQYCGEYGIRCSTAFVLSTLFPYSGNQSKWRKKILKYRQTVITDYLRQHYYPRLNSNIQEEQYDAEGYENCIWTSWLQGEENAPDVIRLTLASIRENANGHPVIVLTEENIGQYIEVPDVIRDNYAAGMMRPAHYADVVRMRILEKYGGIWLDATTLLYEPLNESAFSYEFYSVGFKTKNERFVSESKWIVRLIGGCKKSQYLSTVSQMLSLYWEEHHLPIDYFVFDYFFYLLYRYDKSFHTVIDGLPQMDLPTNTLRDIMNDAFDGHQLESILSEHQMFTLSYKYDYRIQTPDGCRTNYSYLLERYLKRTCKGEQSGK